MATDLARVKSAIEHLNAQEARLVSDRCVELLLQDGRTIRVTAELDLIGDPRYWASHEVAVALTQNEYHAATIWASIDLPWAQGDTIEDCLAHAIGLMAGP